MCVERPKWCGKTRSCTEQAKSTFLVWAPEGNYANRNLTELSPLLARNESTTATVASLCRDIKAATNADVKEDTVNDYLKLLDRCFLIENQEPFTFSSRTSRRLKLAPKRHLTDPSLSCALLSLTPAKLMKDLETFGFMFEAMAERDLAIYASASNGRLCHYQDYGNKEIDAVIELDDGRWGAFEIKLGANQIDKAADNLLNINKLITNDNPNNSPAFLAIICGLSNAAYRREDGVYVLPLTALKP